MQTNKILLGGVAGGVAFFLLGWIIYGILLMDFATANYNQCMNRPNMDMIWWALIVSNLAFGFLIAYIFSRTNTTGFLNGAKMGAIIGIFLSVSIDLGYYSMTTMYVRPSAVFVDVAAYIIYVAIAGAIIAWVMGMGKKEA